MRLRVGIVSAIQRVAMVVAIAGLNPEVSAQQWHADSAAMREAALRVVPKGVVRTTVKQTQNGVVLVGQARKHEDVSDLMRALAGLVSTPRGLGRIVERGPDGRTARVELFEAKGKSTTADFVTTEVSPFDVDLRRAEPATDDKTRAYLEFEIDVLAK